MYTFIKFINDNDYSRILSENNKVDNVLTCGSIDSRLGFFRRFLFKIHHSEKINNLIKLPFKSIWARCLLDKKTKSLITGIPFNRLCFVFSGKRFDYLYFSSIYLRKKYPGCFIIYSLTDKAELYEKRYKFFCLDKIKKHADFVMSFNILDCEKYSLVHSLPILYDYSFVKQDQKNAYDVVFVGREKGRMEIIKNVFLKLKQHSFNLHFCVLSDNDCFNNVGYEGIRFLNEYIDYNEVLRIDASSKAILNLLQDGSDGLTLRDFEAIGMNKVLITNSSYIKKTPFYYEPKVIILDDLDKDLWKLNSFNSNEEWPIKGKLSPKNYYIWLSEQIDAISNKKDNNKI